MRRRWGGLALAGLMLLAGCGRVEPTAPAAAFASATPAAQATEETMDATETPAPSATSQPTEAAPPSATSQPTEAAAQPATSPTLRPAPTNLPALVPTPEPPIVGEVPAELLDAMIAELAGRMGANLADVTVVQAEAVEWPDGSLGCPRPGEAYLQVITPGYKVLLELAGKSYDYRASERGFFFECVGR